MRFAASVLYLVGDLYDFSTLLWRNLILATFYMLLTIQRLGEHFGRRCEIVVLCLFDRRLMVACPDSSSEYRVSDRN